MRKDVGSCIDFERQNGTFAFFNLDFWQLIQYKWVVWNVQMVKKFKNFFYY